MCVSQSYPEKVNSLGPTTEDEVLPDEPELELPLPEDPLLVVPLPEDPVLDVPLPGELLEPLPLEDPV